MRPINRALIRSRLPDTWLTDARARTEELKRRYIETADERATAPDVWRKNWSRIVNALAPVWQNKQLKEALIEASSGKCWYCEAQVTERADVPVDHFRPKNAVAEDEEHEGYWWLACDWENYRYACTFCNSLRNTAESSGGKQDHFPLWNKEQRGRPPGFLTDDELPLLLDPMQPGDVALLTFDRTGKPAPTFSKDKNPYTYERASQSIEVYHLHRGRLNALRMDIMSKMEEHLKQAESQSRRLVGNNAAAESAFNQALRALLAYVNSKAEFSGAARAYLGGRRGTSTVAQIVFDLMD
jgi:uncharacterized protein (TIGR02646 family)